MNAIVICTLLGIVSFAHADCPNGYTAKGNRCYKILPNAKRYADQKTICEKENGFLAVPTSPKINANIASMITTVTFIGITNKDSKGFLLGDSTGRDLRYTNWNVNEPNNHNEAEDCVGMHSLAGIRGRWNDIYCDTIHPAICEACQTGFQPKNGKCYKFFTKEENYADAQEICEGLGAHLAEPQNGVEGKFIKDRIRGTSFVGFKYLPRENDWVTTSSGCNADYLPWLFGQPNNVKNEEHCAEMYRSGQLNDIPCNQKRRFVCEY